MPVQYNSHWGKRHVRKPFPLTKRPGDVVILLFFILNITFITYVFDIEQLVIQDTSDFEYPPWPPKLVVDLAHWYGATYDPLLMERPMWWQMTIWIDQLFFGPFYIVAIYAFIRRRDWIRIPAIIWASVMLTNVTIILGEEFFGEHAATNLPMVVGANALWFLMPIYVIFRMWRDEHPFTEPAAERPAQA